MKALSPLRIFLVVLGTISIDVTNATPYQTYSDLHKALFKDYNINLRPVQNDSDHVNVTVDFVLLSIDGLSERDQSLTTNGWLLLEWYDEVLTWDEESTGVPSFTLQQNKIWRPDVTIKNTVKQRSKMGFDEQPISIAADGRVLWAPGDIFSTSCDLKVTYYPFDVQTCQIIVYLWLSPDEQIKLSSAKKDISLTFYSENGLWEIISTSTSTETVKGFTEVIFTMNLKRRRMFYIVNIIIPILFLSCLAPLVFALPAESGEKMGFCITVLLAYTVFLTVIGDSMPRTSIQTAILTVYLTAMVIISALSVILSTLILKIHNKPQETSPPRKLQSITIRLRRILCLSAARSSGTVTPAMNNNNEKPRKSLTISKEPSVEGSVAEVTWKMVADTFDALFFIIFTVMTVVITVPSLANMASQTVK